MGNHAYGLGVAMTNPAAAAAAAANAAGYMAGGQGGFGGGGGGGGGGTRFRRSTSYPGKNNIFGSTPFHMAPPTLEVTNIDENSDYMYQVQDRIHFFPFFNFIDNMSDLRS